MRRVQRKGDEQEDVAFFTGHEQDSEGDSKDRVSSRSRGRDSQLLLQSPPSQVGIMQSASVKDEPPASSKEATKEKEERHNEASTTTLRRRQASTPACSASIIPEDTKKVEGELELTLMDEVVLLGLKDKSGTLSFLNDSISYVLRGCILMELAFRDRVRLAPSTSAMTSSHKWANRIVLVANSALTGEVLLDEALKTMRQDPHQSISSWMDLLSGMIVASLLFIYRCRRDVESDEDQLPAQTGP